MSAEPPSAAPHLPQPPERPEAPPWRLGPLECQRCVGRGAMGEVWKAVHLGQGVDLAVKLLSTRGGADDWAAAAFAAEVAAAATANHPGVVQVYDHGRISEADTGAPLPVGTPYLLMELITGRPLGRFIGQLSWVQVRDLLLQLLDALAHLHARGVLHRDIKPGNVILRSPGGGVPSPRGATGPLDALLTDFGLAAREGRRGPTDALVAGTPAYMAPEQLEARWRDQGPWTDLYSLGCVGWAMLTGDAPFGRDSTVEDSRKAHLSDRPPAFSPLMPVPPGLEAWLRQLLHKQPERRFPRAADAAWALTQLSANAERVSSPGAPLRLQTLDISHWRALEVAEVEEEPTAPPEAATGEAHPPPTVVRGRQGAGRRTPLPPTWRPPRPAPRPSVLRDLGLNLVGMRPAAIIGRIDERDALWGALHAVYAEGRTKVAVLQGPEGCGRTRLGDWLVERGDEVGAVRPLRVQHTEQGGFSCGLGGMVARALRTEGLAPDERAARLEALFPPGHPLHDDIEGLLAELEAPEPPPQADGPAPSFYPRERFGRLQRLIEHRAGSVGQGDGEATVVLWIDDAHLGVDALEFARFLIETKEAEALPLLVLISVRLESLAQRPRETSLLGIITDDGDTEIIPVRPLHEGDHMQLVAELLPMEPELLEAITTRSGGNPMFAERILEGWSRQGLLEPTPQGFRLRPQARAELPADLQATWADRLERLVAGMDEREQRALELAAALGAVVDRDEWREACEIGGGEASDRLLMRLFVGRFAERQADGGFTFAHAMLREVLLIRAEGLGRLRDHHRAIVELLERRVKERRGAPAGLSERLGRHLLAGGAALPALGALLDGAKERLRRGEPAEARRLVAYRERALTALQLRTTDELWAQGKLILLEIDALHSDPATFLDRVDEAIGAARRHRWTRVLPPLQLLRVELVRSTGDLLGAITGAIELRRQARELGDPGAEGRALLSEAQGRLQRGELAIAAGRAREAQEAASRGHDPHTVALCHALLGRVSLQEGHPEVARQELILAGAELAALGDRWGVCAANNTLGDVSRREGALERAETECRAALQEMELCAHPQASLARLNLAVLLVEKGEHVEARSLIEPTLRALTLEGRQVLCAAAHLTLLAPLAWHGEWGAFDHHLDAARYIVSDTGFVDRDNARMATLGAEAAVRQGEEARGVDALRFAAAQLRALGDNSAAQRLELRAAALEADPDDEDEETQDAGAARSGPR